MFEKGGSVLTKEGIERIIGEVLNHENVDLTQGDLERLTKELIEKLATDQNSGEIEVSKGLITPGDQLILIRDYGLQLRTPIGTNRYTMIAEQRGSFPGGIWDVARFLSKLCGLPHEIFSLPGWATSTAAVFLKPGQEKATEDQKVVAE